MRLRLTGIAAALVLGCAATAHAQDAARPAPSAAPSSAARPSDAATIDVSRLPIDLDRIHRQLRQTTVHEEFDGLNLRYTIDVYGQSPRLQLFTRNDELRVGPVPHSGPTHSDILQVITPQEYRAPAADFGALMRWLADKARK